MADIFPKEAARVQASLLAGVEKQALVWMARRLPGWVSSDHLTVLGLVALAGCTAAYWLAHSRPEALFLVPPLLALNWFGDSLDGTLARVRNVERPRYGFYVDHVVDSVGALLLVGGMALSGYMSPMPAAALLVAYFLLSIEVYLATHCRATFRISFWGFGPTELRIIVAVGTVVVFFHPFAEILGRRHLLFDVGGVIAAAGLLATFVASSVRNAAALSREEPRPVRIRKPSRSAA